MQTIQFRKPMADDADDFSSLPLDETENPPEEEDLDSEIDFEKPNFSQDLWNDYSEDLDYDQ
jgi:hypothetical protein